MLLFVATLCALGGLAQVGFAFFAFNRLGQSQEKIETAAVDFTDSVKEAIGVDGAGAADEPPVVNADLPGAADYIRSLADLAAKLGGLTPPVAALLISTILFFFAATLAAIAELHS